MDKNTLSNYGWVVVCVLVLSVMLALATPFGRFIAAGFEATYTGFAYTANGEDGNRILEAAGLTASENDGSGSTDTDATVYTAYHENVLSILAYKADNGSYDTTHGLTSTDALSPYLIIDETTSKHYDDLCASEKVYLDDGVSTDYYKVPEATFKSWVDDTLTVSDTDWERVKNVDTYFQWEYRFQYDNGYFLIMVHNGSFGNRIYTETPVSYTDNGDGTFIVYGQIDKKTIVENPYNLFSESDYNSYEEYDAAVQQYIADNGIEYSGLDDNYFTTSADTYYAMTYECEGLTNVKVYADRITSTDAVLENGLTVKAMRKISSLPSATEFAQPTAVNYHNYMYGVFVRTESDEYGSWDVYDYYDFKVYPNEPTVAVSCEWNPSIDCGCSKFTFNNKTITCACGSFTLTEESLTGDYLGTDYIYE